METRELDNGPATNKWWASRDARMRSIANQSHYSTAQQLKASQMATVMDLVYSNRGVHVNYRQRFIAIKVDGARVRDRNNLDLLEADWEDLGVKRQQTAQGVIYRIPRTVDQ